MKKIISKLNSFLRGNSASNEPQEEVIKETKPFNIDEFNEWFKTEFTGYDGRKGAPGIFLRIDKLSIDWIGDYLKEINQDCSYENKQKYYEIVRKDWAKKLHNN